MLLDPYVAWLKVKSARLWFVVFLFMYLWLQK